MDIPTAAIPTRTLGRSGLSVSALGVGTWALGGPYTFNGRDAGWGEVDDQVSIRALHTAIDVGVTLIDTAPNYGTGHSERVVGRALAALPSATREAITVTTKFGLVIDEASRTGAGTDVTPAAIRAEAEASLRRLGTEALDILQLHGGAETAAEAEPVVATLEELVAEGKVRFFGTAVDKPEVIETFARSRHCVTVQSQLNVFGWTQAVLDLATEHDLGILGRSPLAMGLLSGNYSRDRRPAPGDVRRDTPWWTYFDDDAIEEWVARLDRVRDLLTVDGRTLIQGALGYVWTLHPAVVPLPGIRTPEQAAENAYALTLGPLPADVAEQITSLLADSPERR
jgi:aryl-alcohol dehydrogenase-like predicted oxidoreductase